MGISSSLNSVTPTPFVGFIILAIINYKLFKMKRILLIAGLILCSCSQPLQNPNFEKNVVLAKKWFELWEAEDIEGLSLMISDKVEWQGAFYGQELTKSKAEVIDYINGWIGAMENINYEPDNFLAGVDPETNLPDGSVRTYGTWTGINTASAKNFEVKFYHFLTFNDDGLVINLSLIHI